MHVRVIHIPIKYLNRFIYNVCGCGGGAVRIHTYIHYNSHTYIHTHIHTYIHTYVGLRTYIIIVVHITYIHVHKHSTHIHTYPDALKECMDKYTLRYNYISYIVTVCTVTLNPHRYVSRIYGPREIEDKQEKWLTVATNPY